MLYIYDILLNWTDLNIIYDFYEWEKSDTIDHVKKIPLIKVSEKVLSDFIHNEVKVSSKWLMEIENLTEIYHNKKVDILPYACIFSDGVRVLALEFNKKGQAIYHSRLLLDEEDDVVDLVSRLEFQNISYEKKKNLIDKGFYTRLEAEKKKYLLSELASTYRNKEVEKMAYLYREYFDKREEDFDLMYHKLVQSFTLFNNSHEKLYQLLKLSHTKRV